MTTLHELSAADRKRIADAIAFETDGFAASTALQANSNADALGYLEGASCARFEGYISDGPGYAGPVTVIVWPGGPELVSVVTETKEGALQILHLGTDTDAEATVAALIRVYGGARGSWGEHPQFPRSDWQYQVANNDTSAGYWEWLSTRLEEASDDGR